MSIQMHFEEAPSPFCPTPQLQAWAAERIGTSREHEPGTAVTLRMIKEELARRGEPLDPSKADSWRTSPTASDTAKTGY